MLIEEKHYQPKTHGYKVNSTLITFARFEEYVSALFAGICPQKEEGGT